MLCSTNETPILEKKLTNNKVETNKPITKKTVQIRQEKLTKKTNVFFAILAGLSGMLLSSFIWVESVRILREHYQYDHKYAYMALVVGLCVGLLMRWTGGRSAKLAFMAVVMTLIGSLTGTLLSVLVHFVEALGVSYFDVFEAFDFSFIFFLLQNRFEYLDLFFYFMAINLAYRLVKKI